MPLSSRERSILDLERTWWTVSPTKSDAIRTRLGISPGRYYQVLGDLVERPEAREYDPLVVARLRRSRALRRRVRLEGFRVRAPRVR